MTQAHGPILIVGQGIAGTNLAWQLYFEGIPFKIIDDGHRSSSSTAAAGLFNPLILKRRKFAWRGAEFFEPVEPFYRRIEEELETSFYHATGIWRRMSSIEEVNDWQGLIGREGYKAFLGEQIGKFSFASPISSGFGYQEVKQTGYVNVSLYLSRSRDFFMALENLEEREFESAELGSGDWSEYEHIILARGISEGENKALFGAIPFNPAKGHTMEIYSKDLQLDKLVSGPCFIIPRGQDRYRIGSTYSWTDLNNKVEKAEIDKLKALLESFCKCEYEITETWAGVRPATKDRRPLIGSSPINPKVTLFNGLGSRAIMTTPLLVEQLIDKLTRGVDLWAEVSIQRFSDK